MQVFVSFAGHRTLSIALTRSSIKIDITAAVDDSVQKDFVLCNLCGTHDIQDKASVMAKLEEGCAGWKLAAISDTNAFGDAFLNWLAPGVTDEMVEPEDEDEDDQ